MTTAIAIKEQNLDLLTNAIMGLKNQSRDSNLTAVMDILGAWGFKRCDGLVQTPLVKDVMKYVEKQQYLENGAANENLPFVVKALQGIYLKYGGQDIKVIASYEK